MKLLPVALLASLLSVSYADAAPLGQQACVDAEVVGRIVNQDYRDLPSTPGQINLDVLLLINFDVQDVRFGSIRKGPLRIKAISPERIRDDKEIAFYLRQFKDKSWWIADCRDH
jgi:hypothetical protein